MPITDLYLDPDLRKTGVKLPLLRYGGKADDYLVVRWAWHDDTVKALDEIKRDMREKFSDGKDPDTAARILEGQVALVAGWGGPTFKGDNFSKVKCRKLLKERPDIADAVDTLSANTNRFFPDSGKSS